MEQGRDGKLNSRKKDNIHGRLRHAYRPKKE
jgi:hypothetical protein